MIIIWFIFILLSISSIRSILLFGSPVVYFVAILQGFCRFVGSVVVFAAVGDWWIWSCFHVRERWWLGRRLRWWWRTSVGLSCEGGKLFGEKLVGAGGLDSYDSFWVFCQLLKEDYSFHYLVLKSYSHL